nr:reverse transcriptase domain-containing protein [Tanacetum cinerariifolium]
MLKKCSNFWIVQRVAIPLPRILSLLLLPPSVTPFEGGDFIFEEIDTFLHTPDELSNVDDDYYDTEGDILYHEKLLNEDPSHNLPLMKNEDLKQANVTMIKPSIEEPSKLELKDLPSHLKYAFLEGTDKLTVIISKEFKDEEKAALLKVLKSYKRAIAWKISDIKDIDPLYEFDDKYISSDKNSLFNAVLEDVENKESYVSNLDEPALLVIPLFDANEDECFDPGGDIYKIDAFIDIDVSTDIEDGYHDLDGDIIYLVST